MRGRDTDRASMRFTLPARCTVCPMTCTRYLCRRHARVQAVLGLAGVDSEAAASLVAALAAVVAARFRTAVAWVRIFTPFRTPPTPACCRVPPGALPGCRT